MSPMDKIIAHALGTLPTTGNGKKQLLGAILDVLGPKHPVRLPVSQMLNALGDFDRAQEKLPLNWSDGSGNHNGKAGK